MASTLDTTIIPAAELTGFAREAAADLEANQFTLAQYFPERQVTGVSFSWNASATGLALMADFRSWDTEADITARESITRKTTELQPISQKLPLLEYDNLVLQANQNELLDRVYDDTRRVIHGVMSRIELARGDALVNGSITWTGALAGAAAKSFGRAGGHATSSSAAWATATTKILDDIAAVINTYTTSNGFAPGRMIVSSTVLANILGNTQVQGQAFGGLTASPLLSRQGLDQIFAGLGFPDLHVYDAKVNIAGTPTRTIAASKVIFVPPASSPAGATVYGTTLEAQAANLVGSDAAGLVAFTETTERTPIQVWTGATVRAMPVLVNPDYTYSLTVT